MGRTFVIAEAGSSHDNDLSKAYRLIEAAKECGADAVKFQWTSSAGKMAHRRGLGADAALMYGLYLEKPVSWLESLKAHADKVGIEFMCSTFLIEDIAVVAPLVSRFKISAFESQWDEFVLAHPRDRFLFVSFNGWPQRHTMYTVPLYCVSKYPTDLIDLCFYNKFEQGIGNKFDGFSDHTANVLTGAAAVAAGAKIIEAHIRLHDTEPSNPDYGHSLCAEDTATVSDVWEAGNKYQMISGTSNPFEEYVQNIRTVEKML